MTSVLTRSPLEPIGMNSGSVPKRRSARLSAESAEENEPPAKKSKANGVTTTTVSTKEQDGDAGAATKKKRKVYDEEVEGFTFTKKKAKATKAPPVRNSTAERVSPMKPPPVPQPRQPAVQEEEAAPKTAQKKPKRRLPTTPESEATVQQVTRRSKRLSDETAPNQATSPHKAAHAKSHANHERTPSPFARRPVTVEKKRRQGENGVEEEKTSRIQLPFADTPILKRNKEMRKASAENGQRRSSSGMRGRRASSLIDEGRGSGESSAIIPSETSTSASVSSEVETTNTSAANVTPPQFLVSNRRQSRQPATELHEETTMPFIQEPKIEQSEQEAFADDDIFTIALPHSEVPAAEFFKHISADLTEPRRMRLLLGWCGTRALPPRPEAPKDSSASSNLEFQALQAARVIQEELSQDLIIRGVLSDWFSRDDSAPQQVSLRKKPNPRNEANAVKAEELERELERLKKERAEWDNLTTAAASEASPPKDDLPDGVLSPVQTSLLDSPQRAILEQLQAPTTEVIVEPSAVQERLRNISENLEFTIDQFAHGIHALTTTKDIAERLAERTLGDAADVLADREKERKTNGKAVDSMDALRGLARVLNSQQR